MQGVQSDQQEEESDGEYDQEPYDWGEDLVLSRRGIVEAAVDEGEQSGHGNLDCTSAPWKKVGGDAQSAEIR